LAPLEALAILGFRERVEVEVERDRAVKLPPA
jgi:hypothetical protein